MQIKTNCVFGCMVMLFILLLLPLTLSLTLLASSSSLLLPMFYVLFVKVCCVLLLLCSVCVRNNIYTTEAIMLIKQTLANKNNKTRPRVTMFCLNLFHSCQRIKVTLSLDVSRMFSFRYFCCLLYKRRVLLLLLLLTFSHRSYQCKDKRNGRRIRRKKKHGWAKENHPKKSGKDSNQKNNNKTNRNNLHATNAEHTTPHIGQQDNIHGCILFMCVSACICDVDIRCIFV